MQTVYSTNEGILRVNTVGEMTEGEAKKVLDNIRKEAEEKNIHSILIDVRELQVPDNETIRFFIGEYMARIFGSNYKIAMLTKQELITHFLEDVAVNRGAYLHVESDEDAAVKWLKES